MTRYEDVPGRSQELIKLFGSRAKGEAGARLQTLAREGKLTEAANWWDILSAAQKMQRSDAGEADPPEGSPELDSLPGACF